MLLEIFITLFDQCCPSDRTCASLCWNECRGWGGSRGPAGRRGRWRGPSWSGREPVVCWPLRGSEVENKFNNMQTRCASQDWGDDWHNHCKSRPRQQWGNICLELVFLHWLGYHIVLHPILLYWITLNTSKRHTRPLLLAKLSPETMRLLQGLLRTSQRPLLPRLATRGPAARSTLQSAPCQPSAQRQRPAQDLVTPVWPRQPPGLTCATLAVTAAIIKTEKIHNILWWQRELVASVPGPERRVAAHRLPAVLLDPVQVEHGVPRVSRVLNINFLVNRNTW